MKRRPKLRGHASKSIRVNPVELAALREELKGDPEWGEYAVASDSELVVLATMFARLHLQPDVFVMTQESVSTLVNEVVRLNIADVAMALGGVAQMDRDGIISVTRPESDAVKSFKWKQVTIPRPSVLH